MYERNVFYQDPLILIDNDADRNTYIQTDKIEIRLVLVALVYEYDT